MNDALFILDTLEHEAKRWEELYMTAYLDGDYELQVYALNEWCNTTKTIATHLKLNGLS